MKTTVKSMWNGMMPVRDVFVNPAIEKGEPLEVLCEGKVYIFSVEQLKTPHMKKPVKDKFSPATHQLCYFRIPKTQDNKSQQKLL